MNYNLRQAQIIGSIGTAVFVILLLLLLLLVKMRHDIIDPPVNQVEVEMDMGDLGGTFGDGADGTPAPEVTTPPVEPITAPTPKPAPPAEPVMTQEDPSVVAARADEKKKAEEKRRQELAAEKAAKEEQARKQKEAAEKKAKEDKAKALAAGAFGKGGTSTSGNGPGGGGTGSTPGNPLGKGSGTSNGQSWSLSGRDLVGSIPTPAYVGDQEGVIIVTITVDKNGNVIGTDIDNRRTNISNQAMRDECKAKARKIKFTANPKAVGNQIGSITYRFKEK